MLATCYCKKLLALFSFLKFVLTFPQSLREISGVILIEGNAPHICQFHFEVLKFSVMKWDASWYLVLKSFWLWPVGCKFTIDGAEEEYFKTWRCLKIYLGVKSALRLSHCQQKRSKKLFQQAYGYQSIWNPVAACSWSISQFLMPERTAFSVLLQQHFGILIYLSYLLYT